MNSTHLALSLRSSTATGGSPGERDVSGRKPLNIFCLISIVSENTDGLFLAACHSHFFRPSPFFFSSTGGTEALQQLGGAIGGRRWPKTDTMKIPYFVFVIAQKLRVTWFKYQTLYRASTDSWPAPSPSVHFRSSDSECTALSHSSCVLCGPGKQSNNNIPQWRHWRRAILGRENGTSSISTFSTCSNSQRLPNRTVNR